MCAPTKILDRTWICWYSYNYGTIRNRQSFLNLGSGLLKCMLHIVTHRNIDDLKFPLDHYIYQVQFVKRFNVLYSLLFQCNVYETHIPMVGNLHIRQYVDYYHV